MVRGIYNHHTFLPKRRWRLQISGARQRPFDSCGWGVQAADEEKKKETGNSRRRRHKSSLSSFWMMASWVVGVCLLRARRSITPRPLRTRPQDGTLKSSHRESSSHHESSQSSSPMPANQNGGVSASASAPSGDASDGAAWDMSKGADE